MKHAKLSKPTCKAFLLMIVLLLLLGLLAGCGEKPQDTDDTTTTSGSQTTDPGRVMSWDNVPKDLHETYDAEEYWSWMEASFNHVWVGFTLDEMLAVLGEPESIDPVEDSEGFFYYSYPEARYVVQEAADKQETAVVYAIMVEKEIDLPSPRGIKVGDSLEEVLAKFPAEDEYESLGRTYFYGGLRVDGGEQSGYYYELTEGTMIFVVDAWAMMRIFVEEGVVTAFHIVLPAEK